MERVYRENIRTLDELRQRITEGWEAGSAWTSASSTTLSSSGVSVSVLVFLQTGGHFEH